MVKVLQNTSLLPVVIVGLHETVKTILSIIPVTVEPWVRLEIGKGTEFNS